MLIIPDLFFFYCISSCLSLLLNSSSSSFSSISRCFISFICFFFFCIFACLFDCLFLCLHIFSQKRNKFLYSIHNKYDFSLFYKAYASIRIQAFFRGFKNGWRYRIARNKWFHKNKHITSHLYNLWKIKTKNAMDMKKFCLRKIIVWRRFASANLKRKELFRICFWPFFVWRKYAGRHMW